MYMTYLFYLKSYGRDPPFTGTLLKHTVESMQGFFFLFLGKGLQAVLHQTVYHGIFTVLMYKLGLFNSVCL